MNMCKRAAIFCVSVFSAVMLSGCNIIKLVNQVTPGEEQIITSSDEKYQMSVPSSWKNEGQDLNEECTLGVSNRVQEKYVIVISESKEDFSENTTLSDFMNLLVDNMSNALEDFQVSQASNISLENLPGQLVEIQGTANNLKITYWVVCTETQEEFIQITGWTLKSKTEQNRDEIKQVISSFQTTTSKGNQIIG